MNVQILFQSTPPAEARGDHATARIPRLPDRVSIHSPRRSEGRPPGTERKAHLRGVSIHSPRRSEGRPPLDRSLSKRIASFNPLPPPKRGETLSLLAPDAVARGAFPGAGIGGFNPLPPPKRGETTRRRKDRGKNSFQSTPPAEARGDHV